MGVRVLKKEEDRIQIELSGKYSLRELLNAVDFYEMNKLLSEKGLEETTIRSLSKEINREWWERNKEWFLED